MIRSENDETIVLQRLYALRYDGLSKIPVGVTSPKRLSPEILPTSTGEKFYLTTAINYTNGDPHFGHAYEAILSDIITRYHRSSKNRRVFFLTGTDEHGQKVQKSAESNNKSCQEHCDYYASRFKDLDARLMIQYDRFVRTTDADHKKLVQTLWRRVKDDIYLDNYEGWYNRYEEQYISPSEVEKSAKNEHGIPLDNHGRELEKKNEEAYFFKMSKYADQLREHIDTHPHFIQPPTAREEIQAFLKQPLEDLCVSRTSISWGIPVPTDEEGVDDSRHVMYVWFDALSNYLTGVNALDHSDPKSSFWPANVHIVGKDIVRFHTVYWPTMLMAAGIPLPECIFAHGFITGADGQKMGKSLGNARDPIEQLNLYGVDALRYYLARSTSFGWDLAYNEQHLCDANNDLLLKGYGNLVQRVYKVAIDNCTEGGTTSVPSCAPIGIPFDLQALKNEFEACFSVFPIVSEKSQQENPDEFDEDKNKSGLKIRNAICFLEKCVSDTNAFVNHHEPWKKDAPELSNYRKRCARAFLEAVFCLTHYYQFFIPLTANRVIHEIFQLNFASNVFDLSNDFTNLPVGHEIRKFDPNNPIFIFEALAPGLGKKARLTSGADIVKRKEEEKLAKIQQIAQNKLAKEEARVAIPFDSIEARVGEILKVDQVPNTNLLIEKVSIGEGLALDVVSGIAEFYPNATELNGRRVVILLNLPPFKPKKLTEIPEYSSFESKGMLLAGRSVDGSQLALVSPPPSAKLGERLVARGSLDKSSSAEKLQPAKSKQWDKAKETLKAQDGVVKVGDDDLVGFHCHDPCVTVTIKNGTVS